MAIMNLWRHSYEIFDGDRPSIPIDYTLNIFWNSAFPNKATVYNFEVMCQAF